MIAWWLGAAVNDLHALRAYISQDNAVSAREMAKRIVEAVAMLAQHPGLGRPGRVPNTRELVVSSTPYIVPYRVKSDVIHILRVFHGSMQWPENV